MHSLLLCPLVILSLLAGSMGSTTRTSHRSRKESVINGYVENNQKPIIRSRVHVFAASTAGFGERSVSLLDSKVTGLSDDLGAYVVTDKNGLFSITAAHSCNPGVVIYIYSKGGNLPGKMEDNPFIGFMSIVGVCTTDGQLPFISKDLIVNAHTTVETAFAFSDHAIDPLHVSMAPDPAKKARRPSLSNLSIHP